MGSFFIEVFFVIGIRFIVILIIIQKIILILPLYLWLLNNLKLPTILLYILFNTV